uniref:Uncharacterized protein n=1 Tax=Oryza rufipogon TaxID=4529 RepID=A0A0E0PV87_ORYRU
MIPAQAQFCCLRCKAAVHCGLFIFKGVAYQINENAHAAGGLILFELRQLYSESRSHQKGLVVEDLASSAIRSPEDVDSGAKQTIGTVPGGTCRPQERMILTHHFVLRGIRF